ncbi:MAG: hypothetical protein ACO23W_04860 [Chitinophagaceae bacterium]|jgi:hypothetical protein
MKNLSLFGTSRNSQQEFNKFIVYIETNQPTCFQIKYPRKDYSPRIDECTSIKWERKLNVLKSKPLFLEVFVTNPTGIKNLTCDVKVDELNFDNEVIKSTTFTFKPGLKLQDWKWEKFKVNSILDYTA